MNKYFFVGGHPPASKSLGKEREKVSKQLLRDPNKRRTIMFQQSDSKWTLSISNERPFLQYTVLICICLQAQVFTHRQRSWNCPWMSPQMITGPFRFTTVCSQLNISFTLAHKDTTCPSGKETLAVLGCRRNPLSAAKIFWTSSGWFRAWYRAIGSESVLSELFPAPELVDSAPDMFNFFWQSQYDYGRNGGGKGWHGVGVCAGGKLQREALCSAEALQRVPKCKPLVLVYWCVVLFVNKPSPQSLFSFISYLCPFLCSISFYTDRFFFESEL